MPTSRYANLRVLVVDDVRAMRLVIRSLLRTCGVEHIAEAADGTAALECLRAYPFDLVICDMLMAPMGGLEMMRHLRRPRSSLKPAIPVLMVSGNMDGPSVIAAIEAGVNEFLGKPLTPAAFRKRLDFMLDNPRPLIKTQQYWGPERRRRLLEVRQERRVTSDVFQI
jgi:two-component system, chemotaxis family, chemotaxis protein CheY